MKTCTVCKEQKPLEAFNKHSRMAQGRYSQCRECSRVSKNASYQKNREKIRAYHVKRKFGIEFARVEQMHQEQGGGCKICDRPISIKVASPNSPEAAQVDHCHSSGVVRGLLCRDCNRAIGMLQDSPEICRRAADYINAGAILLP